MTKVKREPSYGGSYEPYARSAAATASGSGSCHRVKQEAASTGRFAESFDDGMRFSTTVKAEDTKPAIKAKGKGKEKVKKEDVEKRAARFRSSAPKAVQERLERVASQRLYCIDREKTSNVSEAFQILGSTGNVYTSTISHVPSCTCPDFLKRSVHCYSVQSSH